MESVPEGNMAPQPGWWSRNWKWAAPAGCLALFSCGCLGFVVLGLGAAGAGIAAVAGAAPMDEALQAATSDPEVQRALGTPIQAGWQRQISVNSRNGRGHATMRIPLDGPTADGVLYAEADKDGESWNFSRLVVEVPGQRDIDLLESSGGSAPPSEPPSEPTMPRPPPPPPPPPGLDTPDAPGAPEAPENTGDKGAKGGNDINL